MTKEITMTKQQIMAAIVECEEKLKRTPSFIELTKMTGVTRKQIRWHFGDYRKALKACGLEGSRGGGGSKIEMERLFRDWAKVVRELKKVPTTSEYVKSGKYSQTPLMMRFGVWANVPEGMKLFAQQQGWTEEWKDVMEIIEGQRLRQDRRGLPAVRAQIPDEKFDPTLSAKTAERMGHPQGLQRTDESCGIGTSEHRVIGASERQRLITDECCGIGALESESVGMGPEMQGPDDITKYTSTHRQGREIFGRLMRPGPMICAPTNEQGVLFLFGARAEELGFAVLRIRAEYPDCLAFRQVGEDRMELVRIEFEFESKNFLKHMHEPNKCDLIVCWRHNWKECPMEVIALGEE